MQSSDFQDKLENAVDNFIIEHCDKPQLIKISQQDFRSILPYRDEKSKFGLRIRGVMTIDSVDIAEGQYLIIP